MVKKYLIRIIGALCILGALALMITPGWIKLDGISRRDLRNICSDTEEITTVVQDLFQNYADQSEENQEELEDYDLPATRGKIKSKFKEISKLTDSLLDGKVSLKDVFVLSIKAPGLVKDASNFMDSSISPIAFNYVARYILLEGSQAMYASSDYSNDVSDHIVQEAEYLATTAQDYVDIAADYSFVAVLPAIVLALIAALIVAAAVTHICNKGRWLKYLALVIVLLMVVGSCVALPMVSDMIANAAVEDSVLADIALKITVTPFLALSLMIAPIVLDIIFEKKIEKNLVEEVNNG